jgi:phospholipid transport system substrate-binding protein
MELAMTPIPTTTRFRSPLAAIMLALTWTLTTPVPCAAADPAAFIANVGGQGVRALAGDVSAAERVARLRQLFRDDFDIPGIGLFALGRYRLSATPQEQQEFFRVYPDFTVRALSNRLDEYGGATFRVIGSRVAGGETIVTSEITRADGMRVQFDWYLAADGGQYRITDVTVGGVSMKVALRDQFASWIENNGRRFGALLTVLRQQIARAL